MSTAVLQCQQLGVLALLVVIMTQSRWELKQKLLGLHRQQKPPLVLVRKIPKEYEFDNTTPVIALHYDALIPNGVIDEHHVNKILGYKIKTNDEKKSTINQWQVWKKDVRGWAGFHIKNMILNEAK